MRGHPLSEDLRWVVIRMARKLSIVQIMSYTGLKRRTIERILSLYRHQGRVTPFRPLETRGRKPVLSTDDVGFLIGSLGKGCDTYIDELRDNLEQMTGLQVSLSTVWRALSKTGFTMKKITKVAQERSAQKRAAYVYRIGTQYEPKQLVFVDESSFDRRTTYRNYAWALSGQRALRKCFFIRGKRYSVLPAISLDGILSSQIVEGSFNTELFNDFIEGLLNQMLPFPAKNSVIVMDNCRIHKDPAVLELVEERGMRVEFLPPYSPDYNPIELAFSAIKAHIRRNGDITRAAWASDEGDTDVRFRLLEAVFTVTAEDAQGWYEHCGYT